MKNDLKYGSNNQRTWKGICSHGIEFKDTFTGCITNCKKCNILGKIIGYNKNKLTPTQEGQHHE
jgi:hypothetical protein